jgi:hypothetical protein
VKALRSAWDTIRDARRPYIVLNLVYYGLVACAMVYTALDTSLQQAIWEAVGSALTEGPLASVVDAYSAERVLLAIGLTFGINLVVGSFVSITLPSLISPFSGLLVAGLRAVMWGLLLSPQIEGGIGTGEVVTGVLFIVLLFLEGQGYVLATLGAYLQGRAFLWPQRVGATRRGQGYWHGVKLQARIYLLVAAVLLVAAIYEVWIALAAVPALL